MNIHMMLKSKCEKEMITKLAKKLKEWTEIPLSLSSGYDIDEVKEFDEIFGALLRDTEMKIQANPAIEKDSFIQSWLYRGKLYRIIHECHIPDEREPSGYKCIFPEVEYHRMISHWTNDCTFSGLMYKLNRDDPYIILEADTMNHIAFDVNRFRKTYGYKECFTEKEREVIFPMYKECIKEYRISISEFVELKKCGAES